MAILLELFTPQLLFAFFTPCLFEITSADVRSVHPGENITLPCNITNYPKLLWYRLRTDEVKLLISAEELKLEKTFSPHYNVDKSHFNVAQNSSSVSLVIIGVRETDLGFYYCGGRNKTHTQFGKPIRLNFTDYQHTDFGNSTDAQDNQQSTGAELRITLCVCLVSLLMNFICMCVFCCRPKEKLRISCSCFRNTIDRSEKEENIHYASVQHSRGPRAAAQKNTSSDSDSVTYATVASRPQRR
ncbi:uncharacterized protein Hap1MRO34_003156 [Clarias gariepinus]